MKKYFFLFVILFLLWLLTSCGGAAPVEEPITEEVPAEEPAAEAEESPYENPPESISPLYVHEESIWKSNIIDLCWENPNQNNQADRVLIQSAIENTWEAVSLVDFVGWGACTPESKGIRIQLSDEPPQTKGLGTNIDSLENGMILNTTFNHWGCVDVNGNRVPCIFPYKGYSREDYIRISAVHEFGHALGFAHEQNRIDSPSWCDLQQGADGTMPIGGWDLNSVMNYCNPQWGGDGKLSEMDIIGVQRVYGAKRIEKERKKFDGLFEKPHFGE
ncbi:MAG: hypothetical protein GY755_11185 [Chloroflexi bacterium]|nr:hypothetical protein [Chloroflexota bacterium]